MRPGVLRRFQDRERHHVLDRGDALRELASHGAPRVPEGARALQAGPVAVSLMKVGSAVFIGVLAVFAANVGGIALSLRETALVTVVIGGLVTSTLLTLFVLPTPLQLLPPLHHLR